MKIKKLRLTCGQCEHVFDEDMPIECVMEVTIAAMKAVRCPDCGNRTCALGGGYDDAPSPGAPLLDRAHWWLTRGDVGVSSKTIFGVLSDSDYEEPDTPRDPSDFGRCYKLLKLIPEWRCHLARVKEWYDWWAPFIDQWERWEPMYEAALETNDGKDLYDEMQLATVASLRIRYPEASIETRDDGTLLSMRTR